MGGKIRAGRYGDTPIGVDIRGLGLTKGNPRPGEHPRCVHIGNSRVEGLMGIRREALWTYASVSNLLIDHAPLGDGVPTALHLVVCTPLGVVAQRLVSSNDLLKYGGLLDAPRLLVLIWVIFQRKLPQLAAVTRPVRDPTYLEIRRSNARGIICGGYTKEAIMAGHGDGSRGVVWGRYHESNVGGAEVVLLTQCCRFP
jgi:hypothetical protein